MTAVEPQDSGNSTDVRDAFTLHAFLQTPRLKKYL